MEVTQKYLMRGDSVANVCSNFVVTGLKEDNSPKLIMSHVPKKSTTAERELHMRSKLWSIFIEAISILVQKEFGWLFDPIREWLKDNEIDLYAHFVTGVTAGKLFWPCSCTDPDVWYTILVCINYGRGIISMVESFKHGDVLIYNPTCYHGTT
jgi:hypothetical protein